MGKATIGVGVVGYGFMGKVHAWAWRNLGHFHADQPADVRLVGLCARRPATLEAARESGQFQTVTDRLEDLLGRDDVDVIDVCTPNAAHRDQVVAAIEAGKHVYCDKPLACTYEQCLDMVAALERRRVTTQVGVQFRFYPATMRAKQLIDEGRLGRILSFRASFLHASLLDPDRPLAWRQDPGKGGGTLYDLGSHLLDMLWWLLGPLTRVSASRCIATPRRRDPDSGQLVDVRADDMTTMLLHTAAGAQGTAEVSKIATGVNDELRVEIHGEAGALRFNLVDPNWLEFYDLDQPDQPQGGTRGWTRIESMGRYPDGGVMIPAKLNIGWPHAQLACVNNFLRAAAEQRDAEPDFRDAARVQLVMDKAYESCDSGRWEQIEPTV